MTHAHRDLASPELWHHSLERSRRRRHLLSRARRENNRRKHVSAALATAVVAGPSAPFAAAQVSGDVGAAITAESPANRAIEIREGGLPLQLGSYGDLVAHVQRALSISSDGIFGPQTDATVRSYQASAGLQVDGIVGPATWAALFESGSGSAAATGGSDIPAPAKRAVEERLVQAARDLSADGRIDGDVGTAAPEPDTTGPALEPDATEDAQEQDGTHDHDAAAAPKRAPESRDEPDGAEGPVASPAPPSAETLTRTPAPRGQACGSSLITSPVKGTVTSNFGPRWGRHHAGIDIAAPSGTPVRAAACGTVTLAGQQSGYGNMVCITHTSQFATCYAHLSRFGVTNGAQVSQGQVIGYVGCTGSCTGPHLHFETRVGGRAQDPRTYLSGGSIPGKASIAGASRTGTKTSSTGAKATVTRHGTTSSPALAGTAPAAATTTSGGATTASAPAAPAPAAPVTPAQTAPAAPVAYAESKPAAVPAPVEPVPVEAAPVEPTAVETAPVEPAPVEAAPVEPAPVEPTAVETAPVEPAPVEPAAVEAVPVEAAPVEPAPVEAAPVEAAPVEAAPVEAAPVEPAPVEAAPVEAAPVEPAPVETAPAATEPAPAAATETASAEAAPAPAETAPAADAEVAGVTGGE